MNRAEQAQWGILGVLGAGFVFSVVQSARIDGRLARLERDVRTLERSAAPDATSAGMLARMEMLEKALRTLETAGPARTSPSAPGGPAAAPPPVSKEFQQGVKVAYQRIKEEEKADMIVYSRGRESWPMITEFIGMDPEQAAALEPIFAARGNQLKAFRDQAQEAGGDDFLGSVVAKDVELGRAIYPQVKAVLRPSQWSTAKIALQFPLTPAERRILDRWESLSRSFRLSTDVRPLLEDAFRQLHDVSDQVMGRPGAADQLQAKSRELRQALLSQARTSLTPDRFSAFEASVNSMDQP